MRRIEPEVGALLTDQRKFAYNHITVIALRVTEYLEYCNHVTIRKDKYSHTCSFEQRVRSRLSWDFIFKALLCSTAIMKFIMTPNKFEVTLMFLKPKVMPCVLPKSK